MRRNERQREWESGQAPRPQRFETICLTHFMGDEPCGSSNDTPAVRQSEKPIRHRLTVEALEDRCLLDSGLSAAIVADIVPGSVGSSPHALIPVGNAFHSSADDGVHGRELGTRRRSSRPRSCPTIRSSLASGVGMSLRRTWPGTSPPAAPRLPWRSPTTASITPIPTIPGIERGHASNTAATSSKKPFDVLAEGLVGNNSRGDRI